MVARRPFAISIQDCSQVSAIVAASEAKVTVGLKISPWHEAYNMSWDLSIYVRTVSMDRQCGLPIVLCVTLWQG